MLRILKLIGILFVTTFWASVTLLARTFIFQGTGARIRALAHCNMYWSRALCRVLGVVTKISEGDEGLKPGFTVSNHTGYIDILVLASLRPTIFVAKNEVMGWPVIGFLTKICGTIFIDRSSGRSSFKALTEMEEVLCHGVSSVVFPEGTSTDGRDVRAFKSMFFAVPARLNLPVVPVGIKYSSKKALWYGNMELVPHLWGLLAAPVLTATLHVGHPVCLPNDMLGTREGRKHLAVQSRNSVKDALDAVSGQPGKHSASSAGWRETLSLSNYAQGHEAEA